MTAATPAAAKPRFTYAPAKPAAGDKVRLVAPRALCPHGPCRYLWQRTGPHGHGAKVKRLGAGRRVTVGFSVPGRVWVRLTVHHGRRHRTFLRSIAVAPRPVAAPAPTAPAGAPVPAGVSAAASYPSPPAFAPCTATATPATFGAQFAAAQPGQTLCLASGSYGNWAGGAKAGQVTVRGADGASASLGLAFSAASNLLLQNLTITGGDISGGSRNVTVANSSFTGLLLIETQSANANIVLNANTHVDLDADPNGLPARVTVWAHGTPSGVTIANSLFKGGDADGVRPDSDDVQVIGNEFADIVDRGANHADPIQFYGAKRAVVRGNYFHNANGNISAYIMQADGGEGNVITDNVFGAGPGVTDGITLLSDNGTVIAHNTFQPGTCDFNVPCGMVSLGNKSGDPVSRGTVIRDNVFAGIGGGAGTYTADHNLTRPAPVFVGPVNTYAGFRLAAGSAGKGAASDGLDIGIR